MANTRSSRVLIDASVWSRVPHHGEVRERLRARLDLTRPGDVLICPPVALEVGFSARSGSDHAATRVALAEFDDCGQHPGSADVLEIQNRLWASGKVRAAGVADTLIAAYAIANDAEILHYDSDFDHIAGVIPELRHSWIAPRGSL